MEELLNKTDKLLEMLMAYAPKVVLAIITLIIGFWIIGIITRSSRRLTCIIHRATIFQSANLFKFIKAEFIVHMLINSVFLPFALLFCNKTA